VLTIRKRSHRTRANRDASLAVLHSQPWAGPHVDAAVSPLGEQSTEPGPRGFPVIEFFLVFTKIPRLPRSSGRKTGEFLFLHCALKGKRGKKREGAERRPTTLSSR